MHGSQRWKTRGRHTRRSTTACTAVTTSGAWRQKRSLASRRHNRNRRPRGVASRPPRQRTRRALPWRQVVRSCRPRTRLQWTRRTLQGRLSKSRRQPLTQARQRRQVVRSCCKRRQRRQQHDVVPSASVEQRVQRQHVGGGGRHEDHRYRQHSHPTGTCIGSRTSRSTRPSARGW